MKHAVESQTQTPQKWPIIILTSGKDLNEVTPEIWEQTYGDLKAITQKCNKSCEINKVFYSQNNAKCNKSCAISKVFYRIVNFFVTFFITYQQPTDLVQRLWQNEMSAILEKTLGTLPTLWLVTQHWLRQKRCFAHQTPRAHEGPFIQMRRF